MSHYTVNVGFDDGLGRDASQQYPYLLSIPVLMSVVVWLPLVSDTQCHNAPLNPD